MSAPQFLSDPAAAAARSIAVGDVSGDGRDDLVFLSLRYAPIPVDYRMEIYVAYQRSDGNLDAAVKVGESGNNLAYQLLVTDLDSDGVDDIVTATANGVMILRSNADGTFSSTTAEIGDLYEMNATDVDRDGNLDILVDSSNTSATVIHGDGHGGIAHLSTLPLPSSAVRALGDVTGDGLDDLVLATIFNRPFQEFRIYPALASGGYAAPTVLSLPIDANPTASVAVGDFNSDGRGDLLLDEARDFAGLRLYLQDSQGYLGPSIGVPRQRGASTSSLIATDLNRDGRTDLVIAHSGWGYIGYFLQTDTGLAAETVVEAYQFLGRHNYVSTGDLNYDGCGDLVISRWTQSPVLLYGQGCSAPRVVACCSRPIPMEGSAHGGTASASSLVVQPRGDAGSGAWERAVRNARAHSNHKKEESVRSTPAPLPKPRKQARIPILTP
ncbi:MAG: VCBS repeat-containing protein [Pseudoxanthomonas sp.]